MSVLALSLIAAGSTFGQTAPSGTYAIKFIGSAWQSQLPCMGVDAIGRAAGSCLYDNHGEVVRLRAWTYDQGNGFVLSPSEDSTVNAVSADGMLVGSSFGLPAVFDWLGNATVAVQSEGCLMAVNGMHDSAGYIMDPWLANRQAAVIYDRNGDLTRIGNLNYLASAAYGINDAGMAVGFATDTDANCNAFYWNGQMTFLPSPAGNSSVAVGLNNRRDVIGYSVTPYDQVLPVWWNLSPSPTYRVVDLPVGFTNGVVNAVNDNGQAVGTMWTPGAESHAYVAMRTGGTIDLNNLKPLNGTYYTLVSANAVNANGVIVGVAELQVHSGQQSKYMAYIATPVKPVKSGGAIGW